jgi:hypothetical protein
LRGSPHPIPGAGPGPILHGGADKTAGQRGLWITFGGESERKGLSREEGRGAAVQAGSALTRVSWGYLPLLGRHRTRTTRPSVAPLPRSVSRTGHHVLRLATCGSVPTTAATARVTPKTPDQKLPRRARLRPKRTDGPGFLDQRQHGWLRGQPPPCPGGRPRSHSTRRGRQNCWSEGVVDNFRGVSPSERDSRAVSEGQRVVVQACPGFWSPAPTPRAPRHRRLELRMRKTCVTAEPRLGLAARYTPGPMGSREWVSTAGSASVAMAKTQVRAATTSPWPTSSSGATAVLAFLDQRQHRWLCEQPPPCPGGRPQCHSTGSG